MSQKINCPECNHINLNSAKYCSECSFDLSPKSRSLKSKNCYKCGEVNKKEALFCSNCGAAFNKQRQMPQNVVKQKKSSSNKQDRMKVNSKPTFSKYTLFLVICGLILIFIIIDNNDKETHTHEYSPVQPTSQDFSLERKVVEVASRFVCSCGSCGEEALETCTCKTAEQERNFIRQELKSGKSVSQAVLAVNDRYGHLKPEFVNKIESNGLNLNLSAQSQNDIFSQISGSTADNIKIASSEDRTEIFSHFECPCGQCGMPELSECNCTHPKGATEVKLFVDNQIDNQNYTVNDIIDIVEKKYGHKIR
jgi:cytochrome c-type biogenesis protein CcmH/NrfF